MNEENDWDHNAEEGAFESPVDCVCKDDMVQTLNEMLTGKTQGPLNITLELIAAIGEA